MSVQVAKYIILYITDALVQILDQCAIGIIECAGELKCSNLIIVTMNEERVIEKNGYKVKVLPIYKF